MQIQKNVVWHTKKELKGEEEKCFHPNYIWRAIP